jgi:hypothetical protein
VKYCISVVACQSGGKAFLNCVALGGCILSDTAITGAYIHHLLLRCEKCFIYPTSLMRDLLLLFKIKYNLSIQKSSNKSSNKSHTKKLYFVGYLFMSLIIKFSINLICKIRNSNNITILHHKRPLVTSCAHNQQNDPL